MDMHTQANIKLAINHIDEAIRKLFAIHDTDTLMVMQDLSDCIWKLREYLQRS